MSTEQFINLIKSYEVLYNTKCFEYNDLNARNRAWEEISAIENRSVEDCKAAWTKLRNCHTNALKRRLMRREHGTEDKYPWRYEKQMSFLLPYLQTRTPADRSLHPDNEPDYLSQIVIESVQHNKRKLAQYDSDSSDLVDIPCYNNSPQERNVRNNIDETDMFFLSMSKTLKTLPMLDQARIKMELHKAIYEVEIRELNSVPPSSIKQEI